jgi:hypothetical protein
MSLVEIIRIFSEGGVQEAARATRSTKRVNLRVFILYY